MPRNVLQHLAAIRLPAAGQDLTLCARLSHALLLERAPAFPRSEQAKLQILASPVGHAQPNDVRQILVQLDVRAARAADVVDQPTAELHSPAQVGPRLIRGAKPQAPRGIFVEQTRAEPPRKPR